MGKLLRAHSCTKAATQERLSKAMVHQIWLGYLLMSLCVVITDAADHSSSSVPLLHRKLARSSFSYVVAPVKEYDQRHFCDKVHLSNSFLTRALAASSPPTHNCLPQTPFSSFISCKGKFLKTIAQISGRVPSSSLYRGKALLHVSSFLSTGSFAVPSPSIVNAMALNPPPPIPSHLEGCCSQNSILRPGSHNCSCVYPIIIELLLLNVSIGSTTWSNEILKELASQLHLNVNQCTTTSFSFMGDQLNITMDIVPVVGMSFSFQDASGINYTLASHGVNFNSSLFGGYELMNFTWIQPPALPPAIPLSAPIASPEGSPPTPNAEPSLGHHKRQRRLSLAAIFGIAATVFVIVLVLFAFFLKHVLYEDKKKPDKLLHATVSGSTGQTMSGEGVAPRPRSTRFFSFEELKEATNNFEPASMLGEGGFGRVFKGVLKDGTFVAIKKLSSGGHQGDKEFSVEVDMLSRLHHRNLVKLVGYYSSRDSSQHLLCYELVPNGSLEAWLHGPLGANHPLDWDARMKIALDSARGLAYLHEDSQPCVIHRDFKASNILLENNFHAKVADFGLAKQAPEGRGKYLSTRVMGTFGYVAPEYAMTGHLLVKSDVYSYGVVLLELLTGRRPVDMSRPSGQENLVTWARPILREKDRVDDLADPRLCGKYQREDFLQVCAIAAACVAPEASQRPTMGEVVQSLKMVQRSSEYHHSEERSLNDNNTASSSRPPTSGHAGPSSTTFESDASSTFFSSGPYSGLSGLDNDHLPRTGVFSEDLQEGR